MVYGFKDFSDNQQAQLIHPNIHGYMLFPVFSLQEDTLLLRALVWLVSSKQDILPVLCFALDLSLDWLLKLPLDREIFWVY